MLMRGSVSVQRLRTRVLWLALTGLSLTPVRAEAPIGVPLSAARGATDVVHPAAAVDADVDYFDAVSSAGRDARGLYFSAEVAAVLGAEGMARVVKNARMNAAVINLKDERGHVSFDTKLPELQRSKRQMLGDAARMFRQLKADGVYVIGRIVCFSDPLLPRRFPERAILDGRPYKRGALWGNWARNHPWLDPYNTENHRTLVALAVEAAALGVDEIQLDYVRFPVDESTAFAVFPSQRDTPRHEVLLSMLEQMDRAVNVPLSADIFGLTTMPWNKSSSLGQVPAAWAKHVEIFSPMLYLNGMLAWRFKDSGPRAERLVRLGVATLRKRIGNGSIIRPYLQGFPQGADYYDENFITEQIRGARVGGADGFLFWHPGSRYQVVRSATADGPAKHLIHFRRPFAAAAPTTAAQAP